MQAMISRIEGRVGEPAAFSVARRAVCDDDLATALPVLERLSVAEPQNAELRLYTIWTRHRLLATPDAARLAEIEALARAVLAARASLALPLCILAHGAARRGDLRVARGLFRHAAEADPALVDARRGLRAVEQALARSSVSRARLILAIGILISLSLFVFFRIP